MSEQNFPRDYWSRIETMIEADIGSRFEMGVRYSTILLSAIAMTFSVGSATIAVWLSSFLLINGYYSWRLSQERPPVSHLRYSFLCALQMISVALYTSCAVYLFHFDSIALKTVAIFGVGAQCMFNLSRHRTGTLTAYFDTMMVAMAATYFGLSGASNLTRTPEQFVIAISTMGAVGYYLIAQYRNIRIHEKLRQSQDEIIQSQKMSAVGQLTSGVAHDFNNLLTVIQGNIELAEIAEKPKERSQMLKEARSAAERAAKLTAQLLTFSRRARLEARAIDLQPFITELDAILSRLMPASMSVQITCATDLVHLYCDRTQLENAIINLAVNARDAMQAKGNLAIEFSCRMQTAPMIFGSQTLPPGRYAVISVTDDGPGIPHHDLPKVFEPFFTTKGPGEGSGLGLSSVKGFAEQSHGGVEIASNARGTRITMLLPVDIPDPLELAAPA